MPTKRPRHVITESDDVTAALDDAARRWPEDADSPSRLLLRLVRSGHDALQREADLRAAGWEEIVHATAGALTRVYPAGYLEQLRADWDE